MVVLR